MTVLKLVRGAGSDFRKAFTPNGGHEREPDTFHLRFEPEREPVVHAVTKAAAFVHNAEPTDLDPLANAIDPVALDDLLGSVAADGPGHVEVTFTYADLGITVDSEGNIWLRWD